MFHGNTVDGRSSCIPGGNSTPADTYGDEDDQHIDGDVDGTCRTRVLGVPNGVNYPAGPWAGPQSAGGREVGGVDSKLSRTDLVKGPNG